MQRYFVSNEQINDSTIKIIGDDRKHIARVMRMVIGNELICCDQVGRSFLCEISEINDQTVIVKIIEELIEDVESPLKVTILQALPKGDKLDMIVQKATELGVSELVLYTGDRSVTKWNEKKREQRVARYEKIAKEASEQCHRTKIPKISYVNNLVNYLPSALEFSKKIFAFEDSVRDQQFTSLPTILNSLAVDDSVVICIGPEGGFSQQEVKLLRENDFNSTRLGLRILRTETASLYVLAAISYHFEEMLTIKNK